MFRVDKEELAGKSALVTGGTQGVGAAIVSRRDYTAARAAWLDGMAVMFPVGTYWLRRFVNVPVAAT
jgi:hypothetical protein